MRETPPAPQPEELARWLLASEGQTTDNLEGLIMAAVHIYEQLRSHLSTFLGVQGFDAVWARAVHLVERAVVTSPTNAAAPAASSHHLDVLTQGRDAAEAQAMLLAAITQFLRLLFSFIGAELGLRLLQQHWPALPGLSAYASDEEPQQ